MEVPSRGFGVLVAALLTIPGFTELGIVCCVHPGMIGQN